MWPATTPNRLWVSVSNWPSTASSHRHWNCSPAALLHWTIVARFCGTDNEKRSSLIPFSTEYSTAVDRISACEHSGVGLLFLLLSQLVCSPFPSNKQRLSYDNCLEVGGTINRTVLCRVRQLCTIICAHMWTVIKFVRGLGLDFVFVFLFTLSNEHFIFFYVSWLLLRLREHLWSIVN